MYQESLKELLNNKKNFVFIGEAGSGKTEVALSLAVQMTKLTDKAIHFLDMDQTKPNFRARDVAQQMEQAGVNLHYHEQILDTPNVIPGVREKLMDKNYICLLDIGGGAYGSHMIGQFSQALSRDDVQVFYLVNPYRPWSGTSEDIQETMRRVLGAARLSKFSILANPNFGLETTADDILNGIPAIEERCGGNKIDYVCALEKLCGEIEGHVSVPVLPITLHTLPDWMYKQ